MLLKYKLAASSTNLFLQVNNTRKILLFWCLLLCAYSMKLNELQMVVCDEFGDLFYDDISISDYIESNCRIGGVRPSLEPKPSIVIIQFLTILTDIEPTGPSPLNTVIFQRTGMYCFHSHKCARTLLCKMWFESLPFKEYHLMILWCETALRKSLGPQSTDWP
jgi:hypothetical protein